MKKIWAAVICAILFVGIEVFAYGAGRREKSVAVLQSQVRTQNILAETGESTSEEETDHAEEETVYQESEPEATASSAARSLPMGILCIGDEFLTRQDAAEHSYTVVLQAYLEAAGWQLPVVNEGIGQSGSLSIMKYAGVPDEIVHQYAASHPIVIATSSGSMAQESFETAISEFRSIRNICRFFLWDTMEDGIKVRRNWQTSKKRYCRHWTAIMGIYAW